MIDRSAPGLVCLFLAGCAQVDLSILVEGLPQDAELVGVVLIESGQTIGSTGLVPTPDAVAIELAGVPLVDGIEVALAAYRSSDFEGVSPIVLEQGRLDIALPSSALLPEPLFSGTGFITDAVAHVEEDSEERPLTASWLPACPPLRLDGEQSVIRSTCGLGHCGGSVDVDGCDITIDAGSCAPGRLTGKITGRGALELDSGGDEIQCALKDPAIGTELSLACSRAESTCEVDVYRGPFQPSVSFEKVALYDEPLDFTSSNRTQRGYFSDLVVLSDSVVVASFGGEEGSFNCAAQRGPSTLFQIDVDDISSVSASTAPPCFTELSNDPSGDGFLAVFGGRRAQSLGRFGADLAMLDSVPLEKRNGIEYTVFQLEIVEGHIVLFHLAPEDGTDPSYLELRDPITLAVENVFLIDEVARAIRGFVVRGTTVALLDDSEDDAYLVTIPSGDTVRVNVRPMIGTGRRYNALTAHPASGRYLAHSPDDGVFVFDADGYIDGRTPFELAMGTSVGRAWPADPSLVVIGMLTRAEFRGYIGLFDPVDLRFVPGSVEVGFGQIARAEPDDRGGVWMLLGWSGEVIRVAAP